MQLKPAIAFALCLPALFAQEPRKKITRAADVPRFSYPVSGKTETLVQAGDAFSPFAAEVRKNVESVLANYDIEESATHRQLLNVLVSLDLLEGRDQDALRRLDQIKALEDKPAQKLMSGVVARAIIEARRKAEPGSAAYKQAVGDYVRQALGAMPYDVVENEVKGAKARFEMLSEALVIGQLRAVLDPVVEKTGALSSDLAHGLPSLRFALQVVLPLKETLAAAYSGYLDAHKQVKPDIWAARAVTLEPGKPYAAVPVAVWDSGVDVGLFKDRLTKDASGQPAILAYDINSRKTTGPLFPMSPEQKAKVSEMKTRMKGLIDLQANVDSPEAAAIKKEMSQLKPEQVKPFIEEISLFSIYAHGTHVAGILVDGNPYARLVTGRITFDHKLIPDPCPSRALSERTAASSQDYVDFFKRNGVRVVNMSWGGSVKEVEDSLEKCGIGASPDERKKTARELFEIEKQGLEKAMASAPGILFVAAAGNSNSDASFNEFVPSSIRLPNLLTAGAVDQAGDEAPFTSYGPTVVVHANGYEVDSYIPGGDRLKLSGTSMASPGVANLAAKIVAVRGKLTPPQVIEIIRSTTEKTADGRRFLIDPKQAVAKAGL